MGLWTQLGHTADPENTRDSLALVRSALASTWQGHPAAHAAEAKLRAVRARSLAAGRPIYNPELELAVDHEGPDELRTLGVSQTFDISGKRDARRDLGTAELSLGEAEYVLTRAEFARDWLDAWSRVAVADSQVALAEQRIGFATRLVELAERQLVVGDISGPERDLVLLARDEGLAEQATLLADAAEAREAFAKAGGSSTLPGSLPSEPPPAPQAIADKDFIHHPELQVAWAQMTSAERRVIVAERDRRPDPTVVLRGGTIASETGTDSVLAVAITLPLFVRNGYGAEADAARAEVESAVALVQSQQLALRAQAQRALTTYSTMRQTWLRWRASRGTDLSARTTALERLWTAGELSTTDYVLQLKQTLDTAVAGAVLEGRVWQSYFDYLYAVGQLDDWLGTGSR